MQVSVHAGPAVSPLVWVAPGTKGRLGEGCSLRVESKAASPRHLLGPGRSALGRRWEEPEMVPPQTPNPRASRTARVAARAALGS